MPRAYEMALTPDLVARVHQIMEDPGPEPGLNYHNDEDYDALVAGIMRSKATRSTPPQGGQSRRIQRSLARQRSKTSVT